MSEFEQRDVRLQGSEASKAQEMEPRGRELQKRDLEKNAPSEETGELKRFRESFGFFGPVTFLYAVFYAFCMYRNGSGVTFPFFVAGSLLFLFFSLQKLGTTLKKGSAFYMAAMLLLGISTFCTDDARLVFLNKLGIFLLMMSLLLKQFYDTSRWRLEKFMGGICRLVWGGIGQMKRPVSDFARYRESRKGNRQMWYVLLGLLIALPLCLVVLFLLSSADALFAQMTETFWENINFGAICNILLRIVLLFGFSYGLLSYLCQKRISEEAADRRKGEPLVAITVTAVLTLLYLLFCGVQIGGLFLRRMELPEGYTYTMYAREGFFQLLAVSFLNLLIVLFCLNFVRESKALKVILTVMSLCTFVMIASSAMRMVIYVYFYELTFLRILVLWALGVLALLFGGVTVSIFRERFPLFSYSVAVVSVLYLALSFVHPDYLIAKVNTENASEGAPDYAFLINLSADAAPVLVPYLEEQGYDLAAFAAEDVLDYAYSHKGNLSTGEQDGFGYFWMYRMKERTAGMGIRTFNFSRYLAYKSFP